ncbi:MAG: stage III sporulation protein AA [Caldicoprobacterales bacterium]|jgi:stage III sporulation protein AA|nr:stage III sporulation protein AA [Clostridia bacterium]MDI9513218.1 stage III sporulation protein AA [Bacillota bacterium]NLH59060.1 stage III sporulation protein AA [Clostridiales bacterium]
MYAGFKEKSDRFAWQEPVLDSLPDNFKKMIINLPASIREDLEEIRVREARPLIVSCRGRDYLVKADGQVTANHERAYIVTHKDTRDILQLISDYSIYAFDEEIRNGYITLKGGHRVGMTGKAVLEKGRVKTLTYINSFNIRISKEIIGVSDKVLRYLIENNEIMNTLILSPPQMGKTTLLRDIARNLSNGNLGQRGVKVAIVDERSEIGGCYRGVPQRNIGIRSDILDACPKATGIMMLIRSMSPTVIITDEIGRQEDVLAIEEALNAGVKLISSAHASDIEDALTRPFLGSLLKKQIFQRVFILGNSLGVGTLEKVYKGDLRTQILNSPVR